MIARVWHGVVPLEKAEAYGNYLESSEHGVSDYRRVPGNCGACLLRRVEGERAEFLLISFWDSREAIEGYAGPDIERARYFPFDRECLLELEPHVAHYDVMVAPETRGA